MSIHGAVAGLKPLLRNPEKVARVEDEDSIEASGKSSSKKKLTFALTEEEPFIFKVKVEESVEVTREFETLT